MYNEASRGDHMKDKKEEKDRKPEDRSKKFIDDGKGLIVYKAKKKKNETK